MLLLVCLLSGCAKQQPSTQPTPELLKTMMVEELTPTPQTTPIASEASAGQASHPLITSTQTQIPLATLPPLAAPSPTLALTLESWQDLPVIPPIDPSMKEIYQMGLLLGNNPRSFSKIGDCGSTPAWFLGDFDRDPKYYDLGGYTNLIPVIQEFQGSYARTSLAAKAGFNAASVFSLIWSNREQCQPDENSTGL